MKVKKVCEHVKSYDNNNITPEQMPISIQQPYLHQDTPYMSKEQSAKLERDNKQAFDLIQTIKSEIKRITQN